MTTTAAAYLEWKRVIHAMRSPRRNEYSFVPHKYIYSTPAVLSPPHGVEFEVGNADEMTPINTRQHQAELAQSSSVRYSGFMYLLVVIVSLTSVSTEWIELYPISPSRLYNIQVDMFDGRVNHAEFFFQQVLPLGMLLGTLITFILADRVGRATMIELACIPYVLGWLFVGVAFSQVTLLIGRYSLGIAVAIFSIVVPVLLAEISEDESRGRVLVSSRLVGIIGRVVYIIMGQLFVYLSSCYVSFNLSEWKVMATSGVAPGLILLLCMQFVPDSPTWLLLRHNDRLASFSICLKILNSQCESRNSRAEVRVNSIIHADFLSNQATDDVVGSVHQRLGFSRPLYLILWLYTLQAIASAILEPTLYPTSNNSYTFGLLGIGLNVNDWNQLILSGFLAGAAFLGLITALILVDSHGRALCLRVGTAVVALAAILLLSMKRLGLPDENDMLNEVRSALVLLMTAGHYAGLGVCPIVLASEIFPPRRRVAGVSVVVLIGSAVSVAVSYGIYLLRSAGLSSQVMFQCSVATVGFVNIVGFVIATFFVPETKSRSLQEIEAVLCGYAAVTPPNIRTNSTIRVQKNGAYGTA
ncbi:hypothetical protein LEN26_000017 [Aphanomyces euteiches]|nr:hypothetical protein AeMF1_002011 [Aphanomyces euteiches]KAH9164469.1 hypothetical protein LEN26_000017 [Aphanomyces euteiches]KAH9193879.1 hypothetical protein AeNC1_004143 [Aphanomyces euteiches]